jgi:hypothetical protein
MPDGPPPSDPHPSLTEAGYLAREIDRLPQLWDGLAKLVREGLGISGFGAQIWDLPPDYTTESHSERTSGQQELYLALKGSGAVIVHLEDDERLPLDRTRMVAVAPHVERTLASGSEGMRVLCVGGTPGAAYEPPEWTTG